MLKLAAVFGDNAVLQQGRAIPVWGWCTPFRRVRATLGDRKCETRSGADGKFLFRFPPMSPATGLTLELFEPESGESAISRNLAVGEVWIASGQSNMAFTVPNLADGGAEVRAMADGGSLGGIRMLTVPRCALLTQALDVDAAWQTATAVTVEEWSAVALFFARKLHEKLGVTVGVLSTSWGGTIAEAWTGRETLARNPDIAADLEKYSLNISQPDYWASLSEDQLSVPPRTSEAIRLDLLPPEPENTGLASGWAETGFDDSKWDRGVMPAQWRALNVKTNGTLWYRRRIEIPEEWAGRDLLLSLGAVDKHDITYFDGTEIGRTGQGFETACWNTCRVYRIPGELVKPGFRVLAVRDYSFIYDGGLLGPGGKMRLQPVDADREAISLAGEWRWKIETDLGPATAEVGASGLGNPNSYSILFDNMIQPLIPYALRGAIWYQGESNSARYDQYERLMRDLITDWRFRFGQGDFPFLQVVLAGFRAASDYDPESTWAPLREAQCRAAESTGNLVASAVDVGDVDDIHPKDKQTVGERLAAAALAQTYGGKEEGSGPLFRSMTRSGNTLLVAFDHADGGLSARNGELRGFRVAGGDQVFHPADAAIVGDGVAVSSPEVAEPVAVCYGWSDNPDTANLYNAAGLPALPFRAGDLADSE